MRFSVSQRERAAPGTAKDLPAIDAEVFAQSLDVFDQMPGCVVFEVGVGRALTGAALIEEHHAISLRIEVLPVEGWRPPPGPP